MTIPTSQGPGGPVSSEAPTEIVRPTSDNGSDTGFFHEGRFLGPLAVVLVFGLWFIATEDGLGLIPSVKFPSPLRVVEAAATTRGVILGDAVATILRVVVGLALGVTAGVGLGLLMSYSTSVYHFFFPLVESMRPVPVIAMIPFFLLWFGIDERGKIILIVLGVFAIMVVSTIEAVRNIPRIYARAATTLGANKRQRFRSVIIPAITPGLVGPLRVSAALSFTLVVAAEFMGARNGMGFRILEARRLFNTDVILLGVVLFGIISGLLDILLRKATDYLTRWSERAA